MVESEVKDAYEQYVMERRKKEAEKPEPSDTITAEIDRDAAQGVMLLINDNLDRYGMNSQALLVRAARQIGKALDE